MQRRPAGAFFAGRWLWSFPDAFGICPALLVFSRHFLVFARHFWDLPGAFGIFPALLVFPRRPRVLAPKNSVQYPIFVQKMPETGNRCHFHLLIPSIFEISWYQKAKYSCNTRRQKISSVSPSRRQEINSVSPSRRQEINSVSPSRRQESSHSKPTPHGPSQLHVLSPVPPALH